MSTNSSKPLIDFATEEGVFAMNSASKLFF